MTTPLSLVTSCGHTATVKLCQSRKGPNAGKWVIKIRGPRVTLKLKSGVKTTHSAPNEAAAKTQIASYLGIDVSAITRGTDAVKKNVKTAPSEASLPPTTQQQHPVPVVAGYPQTQVFPAHVQNQVPFPSVGHGVPPIYGNGSLPFPAPQTFLSNPSAAASVMMPTTAAASMVDLTQNRSHPSTTSMSISQLTVAQSSASMVDLTQDASQVTSTNTLMSNPDESGKASNAIVPTAEQERIYQHAKPPTPVNTNFTVRITAGAGAGKTTTVLQVATNAARLGHSSVTYVTFAKAAAADGATRIQEALKGFPNPPTINARTLHSCAMKLLSEDRKEAFDEEKHTGRLMDDDAIQRFIKKVCGKEVDDFLAHARDEIAMRSHNDPRKRASMLEAAERQVLFFIFKTFNQFCRSPNTVEQFKDPFFKQRNYYPAECFHREGEEGEKQGFPSTFYKYKVAKYADIACLVWDAVEQQGIRSYDLEMKRAQLKALRIPGSLLLVDESQDMDGCQVDWISKQCNHGTHVYIVGDAAQTIYSFRGARSKFLVNLKGTVDFELTKSWRFGSNIASIANIVLFAKHKSKQTSADYPTWQPYRVVGGGGEGVVTADPILPKWKDNKPITVIAASNATLLHAAVSLLGITEESDDAKEGAIGKDTTIESESPPLEVVGEAAADSPGAGTQSEETQDAAVPVVSDSSPVADSKPSASPVEDAKPSATDQKITSGELSPNSFPKIHINGKGENSGMKKWKSVMKQIQHIYELQKSGEEGHVLPPNFYEFKGARLTFDSFCAQVESRELSKYSATISVVKAFGEKTMDVMAKFEADVIDKQYSAKDADVILTTTHAAKGMEFDYVQVCDDFCDLFKVTCDGPLKNIRGQGNAKRNSWQFSMKNWGDDANLLYVACTRAKKLLSIPPSLKRFLQDCDMLHDMIRCKKLIAERDGTKSSDITVFGRAQPFLVSEALDLYQDVVLPLRLENNLCTKDHLMGFLVKSVDGDGDMELDDKSMDGDDEFEKFFGYNAASAAVAPKPVEPDAKKPKLSKAHSILEEAKESAARAPKGTHRPYDKRETATRIAKCRDCGANIDVGASRVGIQVYQPDKSEWWCYYLHSKCFPKELIPRLRLDPNPNRKKAATNKSWGGKKNYGGGRRYGGGWKKGGYRRRW